MSKSAPFSPAQDSSEPTLAETNTQLGTMRAQSRIKWALKYLPENQCLASSFGIQSAVMLHMVSRACPNMPIFFIDTGYLFSETYQYVDLLSERLKLNLQVFRAPLSPAWQEARNGQLWKAGKSGIDEYNSINKVQPMQQAFEQHSIASWFSGIRRVQSSTRANLPLLQFNQNRFKVHPIIDWSETDVSTYLSRHALPLHPLSLRGYQSVGDTHSSRPMDAGITAQESRFSGLTRECGLHL